MIDPILLFPPNNFVEMIMVFIDGSNIISSKQFGGMIMVFIGRSILFLQNIFGGMIMVFTDGSNRSDSMHAKLGFLA